jgi:16S rRNA G966 N2-methylase RsmD
LIEENLDLLGVPENETEVINLQAETFIARKPEAGWDIIFFDPPYTENYNLVLNEFRGTNNGVLREGGIFIIEHHSKNEMPDQLGHLRRWRILKQGETRLSFYEDN